MKQTHTHVWSLAGEEAVSYSLARGKALGRVERWRRTLWREQSLALGPFRAAQGRTGQRENTETVAKLPQPAQPRYHAWGARPEDH